MLRAALAASLVALAAIVGACGGDGDQAVKRPTPIEGQAAVDLTRAFERIDDALDTEETLRSSDAEARRLGRRVQLIVSDGSVQPTLLDEFGLASLGRLEKLVPSLVKVDGRGVVRELDRPATRDFLSYATSDAARAMRRPAETEVANVERIVAAQDPRRDTPIVQPGAARSQQPLVGALLVRASGDTEDVWPDLAKRLRALDARIDIRRNP